MKNRGFTLIELLGVIIIISLLFVIVIPKLTNSVKSKKVELSKISADTLYTAAKLYVSEHPKEFETVNNSVSCIDVSTLKNNGYVPSINSYDGSSINNYVKVTYNNDKFNYLLADSCIPITINPENCTGEHCNACYINRLVNEDIVKFEPEYVQLDGTIDPSSDPSFYGYTSYDGCLQQAIYLAASLYIDNNSNDYPKDDGDTYCIKLSSPLSSEGYLASTMINSSGEDYIPTYTAKFTYNNGETYSLVKSNACTME